MKMKRLIISIALAVALLVIPVSGAFAALSQNVSVTATPSFVSIANDPADWTINGLTGNSVIAENTTYYSNPASDTTAPSATVIDDDCRFTVTNTSTVATNIVVNFPDHTNGDASINSNLGTNDTTKFGAYGYVSGVALSSKVILKSSTSDNLISAQPATTNFLWGMEYKSQSNTWTSGTGMTSTVVMTATAS